MGTQERFYNLVSNRQTGIVAAVFRGGLRVLEVPYCSVVAFRNLLYDRQILPTHRFSVPIISVGNLTLGGTGKSPMVAWLCQHFLEQNQRPGLVSRGYGKISDAGNDELMEMSHRFPTVPHLQNRNRAEAIQELLQTEQVDLIILDDAFQHRRVKRDIDFVLLDATAPFGFGHVFPRGALREPISGLRRAQIALLTRSDLIEETQRQEIRQRVLSINPNITWGEAVHVPTSLISPQPFSTGTLSTGTFSTEPIEVITGQSVLAFCGIGNPAAFRSTLERCGVHVAKLIPFPDHHHYTARDVDELVRTANALGTDVILCTVKDLVKLALMDFSEIDFSELSLRAVSIEIQFTVGESAVRERIDLFPNESQYPRHFPKFPQSVGEKCR